MLLVDDAQHLDPQAARLVRAMSSGTAVTVVAGDPNQTVFGFRGADAALLTGDGGRVVTLTQSHRCAPAVARAVSGVAARLPGSAPGRVIEGNGTEQEGSVAVRLAASAHAEAALIADALRRAHLVDGVPWSQMAVIVRSLPRAAAVLPRALAAAGVPVRAPAAVTSPADHPAVRALLTVLTAATDGLDGERALTLVTGPIGRIDPVSLRGLRRSLRRARTRKIPRQFGDLLVDALTGEASRLPAAHAADAAAGQGGGGRGGAVRAGRSAICVVAGVEPVRPAAPLAAGPRPRRPCRCAGGSRPRRCDGAFRHRRRLRGPHLGCDGPRPRRGRLHAESWLRPNANRSSKPDTVAIVSAHAALGREWDVVVIAGLQEGLWPNAVPRGGVLATQQLVDVLEGVADTASRRAPVLADERRLLVSALGRARQQGVDHRRRQRGRRRRRAIGVRG